LDFSFWIHEQGLGARDSEGVKKSTGPVIPSVARNLHFFVFRGINADASLRVCDFFQFGRKVALITKELGALKWPKIEKSHRLSA
jgi:hypothetical protein